MTNDYFSDMTNKGEMANSELSLLKVSSCVSLNCCRVMFYIICFCFPVNTYVGCDVECDMAFLELGTYNLKAVTSSLDGNQA